MLSTVGAETYKIIKSLVAPVKLNDKSYSELVELKKNHPKSSVIAERFLFNKRDRKQGERIVQYVAELRRLTEYCDYGTGLELMSRDRLVCGIQHERIQQRLLMRVIR